MREIRTITGLRVIAVDEGASVGTINEVVIDLASGLLVGLILGDGPMERGVAAADIQTIGADAVMITNRSVARFLSELPELEKRKGNTSLSVFTASGRRLGIVSAIYIDPYEKNVSRYEVSAGPLKDLADGLLILPIIPGTIHGQDALILPDDAVAERGRETGGLRARFTQWGDNARKQVQQVSESAEKFVDTGSETIRKEAAVMLEKAAEVSAKARETVSKLGEKEDSAAVQAEGDAPLAVVVDQPDEMVAAPPHEPEHEQIVPAETTEEAAAPEEQSTERQ